MKHLEVLNLPVTFLRMEGDLAVVQYGGIELFAQEYHLSKKTEEKPDANKEILDSMRYQARVDLFDAIFNNIEEVGLDSTLEWMRSRHNFESNKLKAARVK